MLARAALLVPLLVVLAGSECVNPLCFVGDPDAEPVVELVFQDTSGALQVVEDGGEVPLLVPDQGGFVMLIGVRAKNMDVCDVQLSVAVHDTCTSVDGSDGRIIAREGRPAALGGRADGWAVPPSSSSANFANVPACPNAASTRDLDGHPYLARATLTENGTGRRATASATIVPTCADDFCRCTCDADSVLGEGCDPEAPEDVFDPAPGECPVDDDSDAGPA